MLLEPNKVYSSEVEQKLGTRLAADVNDVVRVGEAIELSGRTLGVGAHVLEIEPVADVEHGAEAGALSDAVDPIAGRTPDGILQALVYGNRLRRGSVVKGPTVDTKNLGDGVLVVENDVGKIAVYTVIDVQHVGASTNGRVFDGAAGNDVAGNGESRGNVVSTRLGNDLNAILFGGEELVKRLAENGRHVLKGVSGEATADIQGVHVETKLSTLLEDGVSVTDSLEVREGVRGTRTNMETDADNAETKVFGESEQAGGVIHGSTKLHAESAHTLAIIGHDAEEKLCLRVELGDLPQLIGVVKGHLLDARRLDISDVGVGLAWLSVDDAVRA